MKICFAMRILMLSLGGLGLMCGIGPRELATENRDPWLGIPQVDGQIFADSQAEFQVAPDSIQSIDIHIPAGGSHINYGTIHTKVNTESSDVAMQSSSGIDGLNLHIQLTEANGFQFQTGRNSVELEYRDVFGREKYANFLLTFRSASRAHRPGPELLAKTPEKRTGRTYAVVIGISGLSHGPETGSLKYADRDATSFAQFLKSPSGSGLTDETLTLLTNDRATTQNINYNLSDFLRRAHPEDTVLVYVAGYGTHDPQDPRNLYLLTADTKPADIPGTSFSMEQMQRVFEQVLKAQRVITITDICHGYGILSGGETPKNNNNLINQYLQRYAAKKERAVITASDISEISMEDARLDEGHGVFTYYLLKGLKGEADSNRDGVITTGELFDYLERVVPQATGGKQNPRAMTGLAANLPMSILRTSNAGLDRRRIATGALAGR